VLRKFNREILNIAERNETRKKMCEALRISLSKLIDSAVACAASSNREVGLAG